MTKERKMYGHHHNHLPSAWNEAGETPTGLSIRLELQDMNSFVGELEWMICSRLVLTPAGVAGRLVIFDKFRGKRALNLPLGSETAKWVASLYASTARWVVCLERGTRTTHFSWEVGPDFTSEREARAFLRGEIHLAALGLGDYVWGDGNLISGCPANKGDTR